MARFDADPQLNRLGEALAALRREAGLSQAEAGSRVAMTSQGWGLYESGRRPGLFRPDVQRRLTTALGATTEDLSRRALGPIAAEEQAGDGVRSGGRSFQPGPTASPRPAGRERIPLTNDDLAPWAASGVILEVDPERWPRKDQGCVIDLADGRRLIRLYDGADAESLFVRGGPAGLQARSVVPRSDISRVAAVLSRIDE
ncbi:helix-turn-helix domain-containing protein [Brevundimonas aurifodinae]|uniref:Helix-turn-helix transcriptional regulator n=2 Tax=Brevundimonas TaxID=41275 RepID=A0ABV1NLF6_9CAUL|nr:MAG: hypothetical protein B7Z42_01915 [Brevundimonas sp. 12-68-7]OYX35762.1 MAG: hypothetical protein B7Z01_02435 [Brevundimonas subvibrioides]